VPVAAPSANLSGKPSTTSVDHVIHDLMGRVDFIVDGGPCTVGVESTVLDITGQTPVILRPGGTTREMIEKIIGKIEADTVISVKGNVKPRAPGMKYRHYSPKAEMFLVSGSPESVTDKINRLTEEKKKEGLTVGVLATDESFSRYKADVVLSAGSAFHLEQVAAELFDALRKFDETKVDIIYSETFSEKGIGQAVMNRLKKASSGRIIET
jgi:L-threonylcarbamoyladenylate synthase